MRKYLVVYEKTKNGFSAYVPDLPGCIATGRMKKDVEKQIYKAIKLHIEGLIEDNKRIPEGKSESEILVFES